LSPEVNASGVGISPIFSWEGSQNAETYTFEISTNPAFGSSIIESAPGLTELTYNPDVFLEKNTVYYWRLIANNYCGVDPSPKIYAFNTESLFCKEIEPAEDVLPINISGSGTPTIQAPIEVDLIGSVSDINIKRFFGEHERNKDLKVSLISPDGKAVVLVSNKCEQQDFNCGFDDASDIDVKCPLNNGKVYNPQESLANFNGDPLQGTWIFRIEDTQSGNGGILEGVRVEFCSSQVLDNPFIVRNEKIFIGWESTPTISSNMLAVDDANNSKQELLYTIVEIPNKGQLTLDGMAVSVGDQFSQSDVDEDKLVYSAITEDYLTYFSFTVIDGEGGFIGVTNFEIEVNELTSTKEELLGEDIVIYPNPAKDQLTIDLSKSTLKYVSFNILNIQGQSLMKKNLGNAEKINVDVSLLTTGFYIIQLKTENNSIAKKIIIN
jgi:subtilisin-like proprotein convertase family protein